jgi:hypothetical protein
MSSSPDIESARVNLKLTEDDITTYKTKLSTAARDLESQNITDGDREDLELEINHLEHTLIGLNQSRKHWTMTLEDLYTQRSSARLTRFFKQPEPYQPSQA